MTKGGEIAKIQDVKNPIVQKIENAKLVPAIRTATNKSEAIALGKVIQIIAKDDGLVRELELTEAVRIITFIRDYYGGMSIDDVKNAFEFKAAGKYQAPEHYQSWSKNYVGKVLQAYRTFRHQKVKPTQSILPPIKKEEIQRGFLNYMIAGWEKWKRTESTGWVTEYIYNWHLKQGKVPEIAENEQITEKNWHKALNQALSDNKMEHVRERIKKDFKASRNDIDLKKHAVSNQMQTNMSMYYFEATDEEIEELYKIEK